MSLPTLKFQRWLRLKKRVLFGLFLVGMALIGLLVQFQWVGTLFILLYAGYAIMQRLPARITFMAALGLLGVSMVGVMFAHWLIAQNFAAYSFLLLVIGVMVTTLELRRPPLESE